MRPLIIVALIIITVVVLSQMGVCQGETACVRDCQKQHCTAAQTELMKCNDVPFRECAQACRTAKP